VSVAELITQFLTYLKVTNEVKPREIKNMAFALRWVEKLFGNLPANEFKASQLVMVRDKMIIGDLSRSTIVKYQRFICRCWRWGVRCLTQKFTVFQVVAVGVFGIVSWQISSGISLE